MVFAVGDLIGWKFVNDKYVNDKDFRAYCIIKSIRGENELWGEWAPTPEGAIKKHKESRNTLGSSYVTTDDANVIVKIIKKGVGIRITNWKVILKKP